MFTHRFALFLQYLGLAFQVAELDYQAWDPSPEPVLLSATLVTFKVNFRDDGAMHVMATNFGWPHLHHALDCEARYEHVLAGSPECPYCGFPQPEPF